MLKNILIPERIGSYYTFKRRIIGFDIQNSVITATQLSIAGRHVTIERIIEEHIEEESPFDTTHRQRIISTLNRMSKRLDKAQIINCALPSSLVTFKELAFPFLDAQKIAMVVNYEVEPLIPFSLDEAYIDFIITHQDQREKKSTILVAITKKQYVEQLQELFAQAEIPLTNIVVDILALYSLYSITPVYQQSQENTLLLSFGYSATTIACLDHGQLKMVRSLPKGMKDIIQAIAQELSISETQAAEYIMRVGLESTEKENYQKAVNVALHDIVRDIGFTIASLPSLLPSLTGIQQLVIGSVYLPVHGLAEFLQASLNIPCSLFQLNSLLAKSQLTIKDKKNISLRTLMSAAIAYPMVILQDFNFLKFQEIRKEKRLLVKQVVTGVVLIIVLIAMIALHSYRQLRKLHSELDRSKREVITELKHTFAITDPATLRTLPSVLQAARIKIEEEQALWFAFSKQTRLSFLAYLQELSMLINRREIGLNLKKLIMAEGTIVMQGSVPDFKALQKLEEGLSKSTLFKSISIPQETDFTITITLKKIDEEGV